MIDSTLLHHITDEYIKCYVNLFPNYKLTTIDDLIKYKIIKNVNKYGFLIV